MKPDILLFDGVTGSGKSTCLSIFRVHEGNGIKVGRKLTTRKPRPTDNDWEFEFLEFMPRDDQLICFGSVGNEYAIDTREIVSCVKAGMTWISICTDTATVDLLRRQFTVQSAYVHRCNAHDALNSILSERQIHDDNEIQERRNEVYAELNDYAQRIGTFDYVILNTDSLLALEKQVESIALSLTRP